MQLSFVLLVIVLAAAGTRAQQSLNITACTPPCNLATTPADVVIFIDASTGMGQDNIDLIKRALTQWQSPFSIGTGSADGLRVGLIDYAIYGTAHGSLVQNHEDHNELINLINDVRLRNYPNRNIYYGLIEGYTNVNPDVGGMRPGVPKIGMIFSSGAFTGQAGGPALTTYTNQGFVFYGIGVGINANILELAQLIGNTANVFHTVSAEQLEYVVAWLLGKTCDQPSVTIGPTAPGLSTDPWATFGSDVPLSPTTSMLPYRHCQDYCIRGDNSCGVKPILINGNIVPVYCNGCWTLIQSRVDGGDVDFNVTFDRYRQVIGRATDPPSDYYLGNDNIYALTNQFEMQLWVQPEDCDHGITNSLYQWFKIGSLSERFKLNTSYAIGDAGDAFNIVSFGYSDQQRPFSTSATYNATGGLPTSMCPSLLYGGWWFGSCKDNLNGKWYAVNPPYCVTTVPDGIRWIRPGNFTLARSAMLICPTCPQPF